jgi:hypothetical protein
MIKSFLSILIGMLITSISLTAQMISAPGINFLKAEYGHTFSYTEIGRSFTGFRSVGFGGYYFNTGEGKSIQVEAAIVNQLLKRWNTEDSQANIIVGAGIGRGRTGNREGWAGTASLIADWETRRWHIMLQEQAVFVPSASRLVSTFMGGWAPWLAEYDEWAPWIYYTVQHENGDGVGLAHGPSLILMHEDLLLELRVMISDHGTHAEAGVRLLF